MQGGEYLPIEVARRLETGPRLAPEGKLLLGSSEYKHTNYRYRPNGR
jgi:hypothetical protein